MHTILDKQIKSRDSNNSRRKETLLVQASCMGQKIATQKIKSTEFNTYNISATGKKRSFSYSNLLQ